MVKTSLFPFEGMNYNSPFEDHHLLLKIAHEKELMLFDIGDITKIPLKQLLKVRFLFISHFHMDHFAGFSYFLRTILRLQNITIRIYGPNNLMLKIAHAIHSYDWNLIQESAPLFELIEIQDHFIYQLDSTLFYLITPEYILKHRYRVAKTSILRKTSKYQVEYVQLDHKIPVIGYKVFSAPFIHVIKEALGEIKAGIWIKKAQMMIQNQENPQTLITLNDQASLSLEKIQNRFFKTSDSKKIAYITDCLYHGKNQKLLWDFLKKIDLLFIEAHFLAQDQHLANQTYHLTTKDVADIISHLKIEQWVIGHLSQRYLTQYSQEDFRQEIIAFSSKSEKKSLYYIN